MTNYIYTMPNATTGWDDILVQTSTAVGFFIPLFLVFIWLFVFLLGFRSQRNREGNADAPFWAILASISTLMVSLLMTTRAGMINLYTLGAVVAVTIISALWFFFTKGRNEV